MAEGTHAFRRASLGTIDQARSRHMWTRSAVDIVDDAAETTPIVVTGTWDGTLTAFEAASLDVVWETTHPESAVGLETVGETLVVCGRGDRGVIAGYDVGTGERQFRYDTAADVGEPTKDSIFYRPYVVDCVTDEDGFYVATRRYERSGEQRIWHSTVLAFDVDGTVRWRFSVDASPISLSIDDFDNRLAVGYNRCMGEFDNGLVVIDTASGKPAWTWDPGTAGDRRVGDVSFDGNTIAVSSHGDKRGYLLESGGKERWRVDLAVETQRNAETLYAYPNHAFAHNGRVAFVTGNTYALDSRETEKRHPNEHRIAVFDDQGRLQWDADLGGFVHGLATDADAIVAPCAQNFRVRDPTTHAIRWFDWESGDVGSFTLDGVATAGAVSDGLVAGIEEPVEYHDDGRVRGSYTLHVGSI